MVQSRSESEVLKSRKGVKRPTSASPTCDDVTGATPTCPEIKKEIKIEPEEVTETGQTSDGCRSVSCSNVETPGGAKVGWEHPWLSPKPGGVLLPQIGQLPAAWMTRFPQIRKGGFSSKTRTSVWNLKPKIYISRDPRIVRDPEK